MVQRIIKGLISILPFIIIGSLLYAAVFIKPKPVKGGFEPPNIGRRDYFYGIDLPTSMDIWTVGNNSKILRSRDGGVTNEKQHVDIDTNLQGIAAWDTERAVAVGNDGVVIITSDGGKTWKQVPAPRSKIANKLLRVRIFDNIAWTTGEFGAVLSSRDYGATWQRALEEEDVAYNDICFIGEKGWIVGEFGYIKTTDDGGKTWRSLPGPEEELSLMSLAFKDRQNGVTVGLEGMVMVTHDGGESWTRLPPQTKEHLFCVIWDGSSYVAVGNKGMMVTGDSTASNWKVKRIASWDLSWYTDIKRIEDRYYISGASVGYIHNGKLTLFGREVHAEEGEN